MSLIYAEKVANNSHTALFVSARKWWKLGVRACLPSAPALATVEGGPGQGRGHRGPGMLVTARMDKVPAGPHQAGVGGPWAAFALCRLSFLASEVSDGGPQGLSVCVDLHVPSSSLSSHYQLY